MNIKIAGNKNCPIMREACLTSECMMWEPFLIKNKDYAVSGPDLRRWIDDPENGNCGLKSKDLEVNF